MSPHPAPPHSRWWPAVSLSPGFLSLGTDAQAGPGASRSNGDGEFPPHLDPLPEVSSAGKKKVHPRMTSYFPQTHPEVVGPCPPPVRP